MLIFEDIETAMADLPRGKAMTIFFKAIAVMLLFSFVVMGIFRCYTFGVSPFYCEPSRVSFRFRHNATFFVLPMAGVLCLRGGA